MNVEISQRWFEFGDVGHRRFRNAVWIPLRVCVFNQCGSRGRDGFASDFLGVTSLAVHLNHREKAKIIDWQSNGLDRWHRPHIDEAKYGLSDTYILDGVEVGANLALSQTLCGAENPVWHLNQDIVLAFDLLREEDVWTRPEEGYDEVARLVRDVNSKPLRLEMKKEYLCDYLAARQMALKLNWFRGRAAVTRTVNDVQFDGDDEENLTSDSRYRGVIRQIHEGGKPFGSETTLIEVSREDFDLEEDIPTLPKFGQSDLSHRTRTIVHEGQKLFEISGDLWVEEWIEPADRSPRLKGDQEVSNCSFFVDASKSTMTPDQILDSDENRWLWFKPDLANIILSIRGSKLEWSTKETGTLYFANGSYLHFGINPLGLLTIYARSVSAMSEWQRRICMGCNVMPDGGVSRELLRMEAEGQFVTTKAPERDLPDIVNALNEMSVQRWGKAIIRQHERANEMWNNLHRSRVLEAGGIHALAKDISRLTIDQINVQLLKKVAPLKDEKTRGSLKSMEAALATIIDEKEAHDLLAPLHYTYQLRLKDAHMPTDDSQAEKHLGLEGLSPLDAAHTLLFKVAKALCHIIMAINITSEG